MSLCLLWFSCKKHFDTDNGHTSVALNHYSLWLLVLWSLGSDSGDDHMLSWYSWKLLGFMWDILSVSHRHGLSWVNWDLSKFRFFLLLHESRSWDAGRFDIRLF